MSALGAETAAPAEVVIRPPSRWGGFNLGELWSQRDLLYFLTKRELQIRYRQSFFGIGWAVLQPLVFALIFAVFLGRFFKVHTEIDYPVFVVAGVVPWLFTSQAITNGATSLVLDSDLISKVYFPRITIPVAKALSLLIDLVISFAVVILIALAYGVAIQATIFWLPAFVLLCIVTTFALSSALAAINVKYRDVGLITPMIVQILFFITPIIYPATFITGGTKYVYAINPLVTVMEGIRWSMFGTAFPGGGEIAVSVGTAVLLLVGALYYFQRTERYFADVV
jgi:lipopolysaccharide transport system permease protein